MQEWFLIFIVMLLCICAATVTVWSQETGQVAFSLSTDAGRQVQAREYIREWLILGPFFPDDLDKDFLADVGGEANVDPGEGDTVTTEDGTTLSWERYQSQVDIIDLLDAVGNHENTTAYAFCVLRSEVAGDVRVYLGSDDGVAVWINGQRVHYNAVNRGVIPDEDVFDVSLEGGTNRCLVKVSQGTGGWGFAARMELLPAGRAVISGTIADDKGKPVSNAYVHLEQNGEEITHTQTDSSGRYRLEVYPVSGRYDFSATEGERGNWQLGIPLREGDRRTLNLTLKKAISIEGTLLMLDDTTPHASVVVQAVVAGDPAKRPVTTSLSDRSGKYRLINLRPGTYHVRCYTLNGYLYYGKDKPVDMSHAVRLQIQSGRTLRDIDFRFAPFKKGTWKTYTYRDGLVDTHVISIYCDPDGVMWFGTGAGISRYDGTEFVNFTKKDGLTGNYVSVVHRDPDGVMWFGSWDGGITRYDGKEFVGFTGGLLNNTITGILRDPDGMLWIATQGGVSRYDGEEFVNFTTKDGLASNDVWAMLRDPDGMMWFGTEGGVSRYDGKEFVNLTTKDGLAHNWVQAMYRDSNGVMWFGTWGGVGGVSRYDGKEFVNFTTRDGLVDNEIWTIHGDPDGTIWFGTLGNGISRYDGKGFVNFTQADGLASSFIRYIYRDPDGVMWVATNFGISSYNEKELVNLTTKDGLVHNDTRAFHCDSDGVMWIGADKGGISRYDGKEFVSFTQKDGLVNNNVGSIHCGPDGVVWVGMWGGLSRYDGKEFVNFTTEDGLAHNWVLSVHVTSDGVLWVGTYSGGISRYDGKEFVNFTWKDGLANNFIDTMYSDPDGTMWFGTRGGVSRYDGNEFVNLTTKDGLSGDDIAGIYRDPDGTMWFGTEGGVSRYNGKEFVNFSIEDGLASNTVFAIHRDTDGMMWFGTYGGGVSRYDGTSWASLDTRDGLAGDSVSSIHQDSEGYLWFATEGGITRYLPSTTPPKVRIASVVTDRLHTDLSAIPACTVGTRITIEYKALDFRTHPEKRQYRYRIKEVDSDWRRPTKETEFDWTPRKAGTYSFMVQAIDRDLNYSEPANLTLEVVLPFYMKAGFLIPTVGVGVLLLLTSVISATAYVKHRRQVQAYQRAAVEELQDARKMQMSLIPESAPPVEGFDIAGKTIPANTVGGDFFDYLSLPDGRVGVALADVSGKGLKGAMNAVLTNGMLDEVARIKVSAGSILTELNAGLYPRMEKQMFVALELGILGQDAGILQWANASQPYPLIRSREQVSEFKGDSQLPLGMMPGVTYPDWVVELQTDDIIIFCTDGIIEAENEAEEMYGAERLEQLVASMDPTMSAAEAIEAILQDVDRFTGAARQYDDMTVVVVKRL